MITLGTSTASLEVLLGDAVTTNQLHVVIGFFEIQLSDMTAQDADHQCSVTNDTTPVTVLSAPSAGLARKLNWLSIRNRDTAAATVTLQMVDSTLTPTDYEVVSITLAVGDTLQYTDLRGLVVIDANGRTRNVTVKDHAQLDNLAWSASGHTGTASYLAGFDGSGDAVDVDPATVGVTDHTALSNLGWTVSDHTGTADRAAVFDGSGNAAEKAFTGTDNVVLATSPTIVTPIIGIVTGSTASGGDLKLRPTTDATKGDVEVCDEGGNLILGGAATASRFRMLEPSGSGTNYTEFVTQAQAANVTYTLPADDGDADEVLSTDGSGNLSWVAQSGGTTDHTELDNLAWTTSGHTGTADRAAVFDGAGAAAEKAFTGTGDVVLASSPTIVTPTIASFANAAHDHEDAAGGGQLSHSAALTNLAWTSSGHTGTADRAAVFSGAGAAAEKAFTGSGDVVLATAPTIAGSTLTGVHDAGGADSFEIPNGTSPTVDAAGEIAIDTDADGDVIDQGLIVYHDGVQKMYVCAVDTLPSTDNHALCYDATADKFVFQAQSGSGTTDHAALDAGSLVWTASAHTGTADRAAVFDGSGNAAEKAFTGTGNVVLASSPTIVTPTIADLTNATHDHEDNAGGGQLNASNVFSAGEVPLARGGTGASLSDPGADRILFWDDSAGAITWLTAGSGLTITDTTITASGSGGGKLVDRAYAEYTTNTTLTTVIPYDDTIPQNTEGTEIMTATLTPKSATNRVRARFQAFGASVGTASVVTAALFIDSTANALATGATQPPADGVLSSMTLEFEHVPGDTSAHTWKIRVGGDQTGGVRLNGHNSARLWGGSARATLILEEIEP